MFAYGHFYYKNETISINSLQENITFDNKYKYNF